jgi:hypothetical protein
LKNYLTILTTHKTFSSKKFRKILEISQIPIFVLVDEVHGIGAPKRREGLLKEYNFRL